MNRDLASILALDLGLNTGWALRHDGRIESGVQILDLKRGESPGMRYIQFNRWLVSIGEALTSAASIGHLGILAYEIPHHRGGHATELLTGLSTRVQEYAARWELQHVGVHSNTLKKWTTRSGRADKTQMIAAVLKHGWLAHSPPGALVTDDEIDAIALLHYVESEIIGPRETALRYPA